MVIVHFVHKNGATLNQLFLDDKNSGTILKVAHTHTSVTVNGSLAFSSMDTASSLQQRFSLNRFLVLDIYMVSTAMC